MTPDKARKTIENLLDLGTLKGVKATIEEEEGGVQYEVTFFKAPDGKTLFQNMKWEVKDPYYYLYTYIIKLKPIPLEPKLIDVGTKVRMIKGKYKGEVAKILRNIGDELYDLIQGDSRSFTASSLHFVPESLLVEEEEIDTRWLNLASIVNPSREAAVTDIIKALEKAGYTLIKE